MKIYKYILMPTLIQEIKFNKGSQIIKVGEQSEAICIWVEHPDTSTSQSETHTIYIIGTGDEFPCPRKEFKNEFKALLTFEKHGLSNEI